MDILLDYSGLKVLRFRVSKNFPQIPTDAQEAYPILKSHRLLDNQGDGFKSLVGIITGFILSKERIILLDEPEAFLHPKQCRILGNWIAAYSIGTHNQLIIATHNGNFLTGVLSRNADVYVFRMNRKGDSTELVRLSSDNLVKLSNSPLLSGQPIFESLFHDGVIVCEGDTDRCFYQTVAVKILKNDRVFFVHSYSKQNIKEVVRLMCTSSVPVAAIVDIDILNSSVHLRNILNALKPGGDFEDILARRAEISQEIAGRSESAVLVDVLVALNSIVSDVQSNSISLPEARNKLYDIYKKATRWDEIKSKGISLLSQTQEENARRLINACKKYGLFIVHKGELESWIDLEVGKKNKARWIIKAVETLSTTCPQELSDFVREVLLYLNVYTK